MSQIQAVTHRKGAADSGPKSATGTASHVQILRRQPSILPARSSGRKYGPLATSLRVASGLRPS